MKNPILGLLSFLLTTSCVVAMDVQNEATSSYENQDDKFPWHDLLPEMQQEIGKHLSNKALKALMETDVASFFLLSHL